MSELTHKLLGVTLIIGVTIMGTVVALFSNWSALREIPRKSAVMIREIMK